MIYQHDQWGWRVGKNKQRWMRMSASQRTAWDITEIKRGVCDDDMIPNGGKEKNKQRWMRMSPASEQLEIGQYQSTIVSKSYITPPTHQTYDSDQIKNYRENGKMKYDQRFNGYSHLHENTRKSQVND